MSRQSMWERRILYWVHTIQMSEIFGPSVQNAVAPSNALKKLFLSLDTRKSTKEWYWVECEWVAGVRMLTTFLVIRHKSWNLWMNIVFETPWKNYFWTGPKNCARTFMRCHIQYFWLNSLSLAILDKASPPCRTVRRGRRWGVWAPPSPPPGSALVYECQLSPAVSNVKPLNFHQ